MLRAVHVATCVVWLSLASATAVAQSISVQEAQERLETLGLSPGPVDGLMGSMTRSALREFQRRNDLPVTGELDPATQSALLGGLRQAPSSAPVAAPSAVPAPEVTLAPLPPPEAAQPEPAAVNTKASTQTAGPASAPSSSAPPQRQAGASPSAPPSSNGTYIALAAAGLFALWWLRRRARNTARIRSAMRMSEEQSVESMSEARRNRRREPKISENASLPAAGSSPDTRGKSPSRTEELRARVNAAAERRRLNQSAGLGSDNPTARRQQEKDEVRATPPRPAEVKRSSGSTSRGWIPAGENTVVAGKSIGGMVYVGRAPSTGKYGRANNAYIDPALSVASRADDLAGDGLHYWPSYTTIDARARATYLEWLTTGRSNTRYNVGYVFLYFYGLENRYFQDQPSETERQAIIAEVERLLEVYGANGSVRRYLGAFLEAARLVVSGGVSLKPVFERTSYEIPLTVRLAVGHMLAGGEQVPAEWMLSWLCTHPERSLRTPAQRAFPEFKALFESRFQERFPNGLKVSKPRRTLQMSYTAASGNFTSTMSSASGDIPDISGLSKPLDIVWEIADEAMSDLDKFSRYLGRNPEGRGTIEAHALLPDAIKDQFPCAELESLKTWVSEHIANGGLVPVADLVERLEGARPDSIGKRQLTSAADALGALAIGMAPDPRFALRAPKFEEPVVLFQLPEGEPHLEVVSPGYQSALLAITLGTFIAHADGSVSDLERRHLESRIEATAALTMSERARLKANLDWMMAVPPDLSLFRRRLKDTSQDIRAELGRVSLAVAGSDGHIDPAEINAIQKLYSALGLEAANIYGELHALAASSEPVLVHEPSTTGVEYSIPPNPNAAKPSAPTGGVELNHDRIAVIMSDTARVSGVLHEIFSEEDEPEDSLHEPEITEAGSVDDQRFDGLDAKHRALVLELLSSQTWSEEQFGELASQFGLMPSGAMETLNEWAYDRYDEPLLEEDDDLIVSPEIAAQLAA